MSHFAREPQVGIRDKKLVPTLGEFIDRRSEPWVRSRLEKTAPTTSVGYYRVGISAIKKYKPLVGTKLGAITSETVAEFAADRKSAECKLARSEAHSKYCAGC